MKQPINYEQIENYLQGQLSKAEKVAFEKEIQQDDALAKEVAIETTILKGIQVSGKQQLTTDIQEISKELDVDGVDIPIYGDFSDEMLHKGIQKVGKEDLKKNVEALQAELDAEDFFEDIFDKIAHKQKKESPTVQTAKIRSLRPIRRILAIAASVAIILFGTWFVFFPDSGSTLDQNFTPYANVLSQNIDSQVAELGMGTGEAINKLKILQQGMQAYDNGNYTTAIQQLGGKDLSMLASADRQLVHFYLALSYLGTDNLPKAIPLLTSLADTPQFAHQADAQWYLLLSYLETGNKVQVNRLKEVLKQHPVYGEKVAEI